MAPVNDSVERIRSIADRVARSHGLEIFDVRLRREANGWVLRVVIDRPGPAATAQDSVSIEDCQRVSRDLATVLDVEDPLPHAYTLEVSSPGLDRPLRSEADYRRFTGRLAKIILAERVDGQTFFKGRLRGLEDGQVLIESEGAKLHRVPVGVITRGNLEVEF
jgi:ribosome maturation factor RimP